MNNLEAIRANISDAHGVVLTENHFVKALADQGLQPEGDYNDPRKIDLSTLQLYDVILGGASLTEGHLSYNFTESVEKAKRALQDKLGIEEKKNTIRSPKVW